MNATAKQPRMPRIGRHSSGQARMTLGGRVHYLGEFGSAAAMQKAAELWAQFLANGSKPLVRAPNPVQATTTVADLFAEYRRWLTTTGRFRKNGKDTSQRALVEGTLRSFEAQQGSLRLSQLSEAAMVRWRDVLEQNQKLTRPGINRRLSLVRQAFIWARERGYIDRATWADVAAARMLQRGQCGSRAEGRKPKAALAFETIEKVAAAASPSVVGAMVRVQMATGMRGQEVCSMRWQDIDKNPAGGDGCWLYTVANGKSAHHGKVTTYWLPKTAQELLSQFPGTPQAFVFQNSRGVPWATITYRLALTRACTKAGVARFGPHTVRHSFLTWAAREFGVVAASRCANHSSVTVTARYVHANDSDSLRVAAAVQARISG